MLAELDETERARLFAALPEATARALLTHWPFWARAEQLPPEGDWRTWLFLGGRGAGKTRAGAEWVRAQMEGPSPLIAGLRHRMALLGAGLADVREVMIEGPSGLIAIAPTAHRPVFEVGRRRLIWPNGAVAQVFSAEDPDSLRGPQFDGAWCDEYAAWPYRQAAFDMLGLGLRLGTDPRMMVTTTPRPIATLKALMARKDTAITRAGTKANAAFLAPGFLADMQAAYGGSHLARQELDGDIVEDAEGALWTRALIARAHRQEFGHLPGEFTVVALDPAVSTSENADRCGIVAAHRRGERFTVLADRSVQGAAPDTWAAAVSTLAGECDADSVVAEANQGGELVRTVLRGAGLTLPVRLVHARLGKTARAVPVVQLYAQGRVAHRAGLTALEDEMCQFGSASFRGSPDRVDALVWALTALMPSGSSPQIRSV